MDSSHRTHVGHLSDDERVALDLKNDPGALGVYGDEEAQKDGAVLRGVAGSHPSESTPPTAPDRRRAALSLTLEPGPLARRLTLQVDGYGNLLAAVYVAREPQHVVFGMAACEECRLRLSTLAHVPPVLWIRGTAFTLYPDEVPAVRAFVSAHGIAVLAGDA